VHLSVKPLPKHMRLLPIIEEAVSKIAIMKVRPARMLPAVALPTLMRCVHTGLATSGVIWCHCLAMQAAFTEVIICSALLIPAVELRQLGHDSLPSMQVTVTDVVCSGRARVSLKPLLNDLPLVGAIQVHPVCYAVRGSSWAAAWLLRRQM